MKDISDKRITLRGDIDFASAQRAAEKIVGRRGDPFMIAWYDEKSGDGGPSEPCGGESRKCVEDYARAHGAAWKVTVNNGEYLFYFARTPPDVDTLDRDEAVDVHRNLPRGHDNIQGG